MDLADSYPDAWALDSLPPFRRQLLQWFDQHQRDLPWRRRKTLYRIWVSEIMLQQTQVSTVVDYYQRFVKRFPSVEKLAAAETEDVLKLWEGLGYYRRARQMHAAAQVVVDRHRGRFPRSYDAVLDLPGIGRYTAGAILSIATDQRFPVLEGNTQRLYSRLLRLKSDPKSTSSQRTLWQFADALVPGETPRRFQSSPDGVGGDDLYATITALRRVPVGPLVPDTGKWRTSGNTGPHRPNEVRAG